MFEYILIIFSIILSGKFILFAFLLFYHNGIWEKNRVPRNGFIPYSHLDKGLVSILIPCFNEEQSLENCVNSLLRQNYKNCEIIIIDDGSLDRTSLIAEQLESDYDNVFFVSKENGGKASALNRGLMEARGSIIVCIDADSVFLTNTVAQIIRCFEDESIDAVCGNVKVVNRDNHFGKNQALEYISGLNIERRSFDIFKSIPVIPGAIGAFRRKVIEEVNGYSDETLVEDMDLTIELGVYGYRVVYCPDALAYTEAPETLRSLYKQRYRWTYGRFQVLYKYRRFLFNKKGYNLGLLGLPYLLLAPFLYFVTSIAFLFIVIASFLVGDTEPFIYFLGVSVVAEFSLLFYILNLERENKTLLGSLVSHYLWYRHFIIFINIIALVGFVFSVQTSWQKIERLGKNLYPKNI